MTRHEIFVQWLKVSLAVIFGLAVVYLLLQIVLNTKPPTFHEESQTIQYSI